MGYYRPIDLLAVVVRHKEITVNEAAKALGVTPQRISQISERLVEAEMITKTADPLNKARYVMRPTREGIHRIRHPMAHDG